MIGAIVLAGGRGKRMQAGINKQYLQIEKRSVLSYAIESMAAVAQEIIVVAAAGEEKAAQGAIQESGVAENRCQIVIGGKERQDSVRHALIAMPETWEKVLIHDGARPFVPTDMIWRLLEAIEPNVGAIPGIPVSDTIKRIDEAGFVVETPPRQMLRAAQTPQCFLAKEIKELHLEAEKAAMLFTDDAAIYEYGGKHIRMVEGDRMSKKLTVKNDLIEVNQLKVQWEAEHESRTGI